MAFTKVLGPGIHTLSNITSHNIHSSGIITATGFDGPFTNLNVTGVTTFSGDVSIGGTLTYEDVKNIDSIGIVTAREGIFIPDNKRLDFGGTAGNGDFEIRHTSGNTFIENNTGSFFISQGTAAASSPLIIHGGSELQLKHYYGNGGQLFALKSVRGYQTEIYWQGQKKIETTAKGVLVGTGVTIETNGQATYSGIVTATAFVCNLTGNPTGSGANLTNLPAANLTGTLPAISGANLTGIEAGIQTSVPKSVSGITTVLDLSKDDFKITAAGITTIDVRGGSEGNSHTIRIHNSGITTVGFSTYFLFPSGAAPIMPTSDGAVSLISFTVDRQGAVGLATQLLAGSSVNFS